MRPYFRKEISISLATLVFSLFVSSFIVFAQEEKAPPSVEGCVSPPSGLVSWWSADSVSVNTVSDTKGRNHGTISRKVLIVPGKVGNAFKFDSSRGSISMGNPGSLNFGVGQFSLEAWFKWDGGGSNVNNIIRKSNYPQSGPGSGYWVRIGRDNKTIEFSTGATTGPAGQSIMTAPVSSGVWHHVVATKDSADFMKLYLDGRSTGTFLRQAPETQTTSDAPFTLGSWYGSSEFFSGLIDEVSVYSRALSASEVAAIYSAGDKGKCSLEEKKVDVCPKLQPIDCLPKHHHKTITTPEGCTVLTCVPNDPTSFTYPVAELGNCKNESECRAYCKNTDDINVVKACVAFAEKHNLVSKDELDIMKKLLELGYTKGPGGCRDQKQCKAYCEDTAHMDECLDFAEKLGLMSAAELAEARKIADALRAGAKLPGGCRDKAACEAYCEDLSHLTECIDFAEKAGFLTGDDLEMAKKMVKAGVTKTPGNCKGKKQCETYCAAPSHLAECADFGEKIGVMTKEEADAARKIGRSGITKFPGDCRGKEACDLYCQDENHFDECIDFAEKVGLVTKDEVDLFRKTHGKSPGDCAKGRAPEDAKKACSAYCGKRENQQVCMDFAVQIGLITAEDAQELAGGGSLEDFNACLPLMDQEMLSCFDVLGKDFLEKVKVGEVPDGPQDLQKMLKGMREVRSCLNKQTDKAFGSMTKDFPDALMCLEKEIGPNPVEQIKSGRVSCQQFAGMQDRIKTCFTDIFQSKIDECLNLSCSELTACLDKLTTGQKGGDSSQQAQADPAFEKKMKDKVNSCIAEQINECLAKDCSEVNACFAELQKGGGEKKEGGESQLDPALEAQITEKIKGCATSKQGGGGQGDQGGPPAGSFPQPPAGGFPQIPQQPQMPATPGGPSQPQVPGTGIPQYPQQAPGETPYEIPITPELCVNFAGTPSCSYVGSPDSENYKLCVKCFPEKTQQFPYNPPAPNRYSPFAVILNFLLGR